MEQEHSDREFHVDRQSSRCASTPASNQNLSPDVMQVMQVVTSFLRNRGYNPTAILTADDYERFLKGDQPTRQKSARMVKSAWDA
jgi:hypothetical protein